MIYCMSMGLARR